MRKKDFNDFNKTLTFRQKAIKNPLKKGVLNSHWGVLNSQGIEFTPIEFIYSCSIYLLLY